jgi:hypothetical protein
MEQELDSKANVIEIWYADDRPREVSRFFIALINNWPKRHPYTLVTEFVFPRHEFSDESPQPVERLQLNFDELNNSQWQVDDQNWIVSVPPLSDGQPVQVICHNFWFHYRFKISKHQEEAGFIKERKGTMAIGRDRDLLKKGVEILSRYVFDEGRLIVFASDLKWAEDRVDSFEDFSGVLFLTELSNEIGDLKIMPRFGISNFLNKRSAESGRLREEGVAHALDKTSTPIEAFLTEEGWERFFSLGLHEFISRLEDKNKWLTDRFEELKDLLRAERNETTEFFISALETVLGKHTRKTILEEMASSQTSKAHATQEITTDLMVELVSDCVRKFYAEEILRHPDSSSDEIRNGLAIKLGLHESLFRRIIEGDTVTTSELFGGPDWTQANKREIYSVLRQMAEQWIGIADKRDDRFDKVASIFLYDVCYQKGKKGLSFDTICGLLKFRKGHKASVSTRLREYDKKLSDPTVREFMFYKSQEKR